MCSYFNIDFNWFLKHMQILGTSYINICNTNDYLTVNIVVQDIS